ncbi:MAG TPA: hypothetical protein VE998_09215 [Terriglobales bacterium]|nr:hypothetical protein [Terriglobales bacterium]
MSVRRKTSSHTWARLDKLLNQIERRAAQIKDDTISHDAHLSITLLHNLAAEIHGEDQAGEPHDPS